jgi:autotransporter-associated beta strand protein
MILNGATLAGSGSVDFGAMSAQTGMVFTGAGYGPTSTIATTLQTTMGMVKFGPGSLVLSASNTALAGGIIVSSGILNAQNSGALGIGGPGNGVLVAAGAALQVQGNVNLPAVEVSVSGTGPANSGGLESVSGTNSLSGVLNLTNNLQIATDSGVLTLAAIQGSYNITKTGPGTLALPASDSDFLGSIAIADGTLDLSSSAGLGMDRQQRHDSHPRRHHSAT